jgi:hypothetical protein
MIEFFHSIDNGERHIVGMAEFYPVFEWNRKQVMFRIAGLKV